MLNFIFSDCDYILTSPSGLFTSPDYPAYYDNNVSICWFIDTGYNYMRISLPFVETEPGRDYIRAYDVESTTSPLILLQTSGNYGVNGYYAHTVVSSSKMLVVLTSDSVNNLYRGFNAEYSPCTVLTSASGTISSPNYPNVYNNMASVCWVISRPVDYVITLTFKIFFTDYNMDIVRVYDGNSTGTLQLLSASGTTVPSAVTSSSNEMLIVFTSDIRSSLPGFQADFYSVLVG